VTASVMAVRREEAIWFEAAAGRTVSCASADAGDEATPSHPVPNATVKATRRSFIGTGKVRGS
jgi:hypothetical protein